MQQILRHEVIPPRSDLTNDELRRIVKSDMMTEPIAYIASSGYLVCKRQKFNERLLYIPSVGPDSTFLAKEIGIVLAKGSKLTPYFNTV